MGTSAIAIVVSASSFDQRHDLPDAQRIFGWKLLQPYRLPSANDGCFAPSRDPDVAAYRPSRFSSADLIVLVLGFGRPEQNASSKRERRRGQRASIISK